MPCERKTTQQIKGLQDGSLAEQFSPKDKNKQTSL